MNNSHLKYIARVNTTEGVGQTTKHEALIDALIVCRSAYKPYSWTVTRGSQTFGEYESLDCSESRVAAERLAATHEERYREAAANRTGELRGFTND